MVNFLDTVSDVLLRITVVTLFGIGLAPIGVFMVAHHLNVQQTHFNEVYVTAVVAMLASLATCAVSFVVGNIVAMIADGIHNREAQRRYLARING